MKIIYILFLLLLAGGEQASAQQQQFVNNWRLSISETVALADTSYARVPDAVRVRAEKAMDGREFHFNASGQITIIWKTNGQNQSVSGTWIYSASENCIDISIQQARQRYIVLQVTDSVLILKPQGNDGLYQQLYFKRIAL